MLQGARCATAAAAVWLLVSVLFGGDLQAAQSRHSEKMYFEQAVNQVGRKNFADALRVFQYLVRRQPANALYWFNLGNTYFLLGQHEKALGSYLRVSELGSPLGIPARLYSIKVRRKQGRIDDARALLQSAELNSLPPRLKQEFATEREGLAQDYLARALTQFRAGELEQSLRDVRFSVALAETPDAVLLRGMIHLKLGHTEDGRRQLEKVAAKEARGLLAVFPDDTVIESRERLTLETSAGYQSNFFALGKAAEPIAKSLFSVAGTYNHGTNLLDRDWGVNLDFRNDEVIGSPRDRFTTLTLAPYVMSTEEAVWVLIGTPALQFDIQGSSPYALHYGVGLGLQYRAPAVLVGISYRYARDLGLSPDSAFSTGYSEVRKFYLERSRRGTALTVGVLNRIDRSSDLLLNEGVLPLSGQGLGPFVNSVLRLDGTELAVNLSYLFFSFDSVALPDEQLRRDRQLSVAVRGTHPLGRGGRSRGLKAFLTLGHVRNQSTLDSNSIEDRNYVQWIGSGGVTWELGQ